MHRLCWEVFRSFAYSPLPVNPLKVAITNIKNITINAMTNEKQFKVRSLIGQFHDISDISGRSSSRTRSWCIKVLSETMAASMFSIQLSIRSATYGVVLKIPFYYTVRKVQQTSWFFVKVLRLVAVIVKCVSHGTADARRCLGLECR
jgi:hypothetical protein